MKKPCAKKPAEPGQGTSKAAKARRIAAAAKAEKAEAAAQAAAQALGVADPPAALKKGMNKCPRDAAAMDVDPKLDTVPSSGAVEGHCASNIMRATQCPALKLGNAVVLGGPMIPTAQIQRPPHTIQ